MSTGVRLERDGNVAEIVLSRPERRNALTRTVMAALTEAFSELAGDAETRAIVVRGDGGFFCSGLDLTEIRSERPPAEAWPGVHAAIAALDTPVITALQGGAINAGAALALAGDLLIAGEHSYLQIMEAEMGLTPPVNAAWLAVRYPPAVGLQLALTCRRFTGPDLHRLGVALDVIDDDAVARHAHELAARLAAFPRRGASAAKITLRDARGESVRTFLAAVDSAQSRNARSLPKAHGSPVTPAGPSPSARSLTKGQGMGFDYILYQVADQIAYVTINRPQVMNALHAEAKAELRDAVHRFRDDDSARVAIITGAGERAFSAGNDLRATAERTSGRSRHDPAEAAPSASVPVGTIISDSGCPKPVIAAVNGYALGGGFELALACDVIVASESARFGLPEPRVGLVASGGGLHRLPQQVPLKIAMGLLLTGTQIDAAEAARLGLVNEVVPAPELMRAATAWAAQMLECSPVSLRITKESVYSGLALSVEDAMDTDHASGRLARLFSSADAVEGPLAFAQKRAPQWQGR